MSGECQEAVSAHQWQSGELEPISGNHQQLVKRAQSSAIKSNQVQSSEIKCNQEH